MLTRARQAQAEDGFILIEVLVSAVILAIVAGAVLTLITATTRSAASARSHSVAYGLAQENQARLRTFQISALNRYTHREAVELGGTEYTIESRGTFVNDKSGTGSCTSENDSADYVEITSTVSSPTLLNPISLQSIVSPTSGSLDQSHATIAFQVNNAKEGGVAGVSLTGSGPGNFNGSSDSSGCAIFTDLPYGNYAVTADGHGLITPEGNETWTKEQVGAPAHGIAQVPISFDRPGTIKQEFVYADPTTGAMKPAPVDSMELFESENESKTITYGTPNLSSRTAIQIDERVYPFKTKYKVYAGSCTSNDPDPKNNGSNAAAIAHVEVTGWHVATPPPIQVPALNLTVTDSNGKVVQGAKVILTDTTCKYNGKNVKREFTTNKTGHIVNSKTELGTETQAVGLPFGTYEICVSATVGGQTRRAEATGTNAATVSNLSSAATRSLTFGTTGGSECT